LVNLKCAYYVAGIGYHSRPCMFVTVQPTCQHCITHLVVVILEGNDHCLIAASPIVL